METYIMKNNFCLFFALLMLTQPKINQAASITPTDMNAWFDNYQDTQSKYSQELLDAAEAEAKAEQDIAASAPDFSDAVAQIQQAYAQDPVGALATILDPAVAKSILLTPAQLTELGQAAGLTPAQAADYASGKFADPQGIMQLLKNGFKTGNITDVSSALNLIKASSSQSSLNYELTLDLQAEVADPNSSLYTRMIEAFTPDQVETILTNANIEGDAFEYVYMRSLGNNITNALVNPDVEAGISQITSSLQKLSALDPSFAKELCQNGNPLGKDTLIATYELKYTPNQLGELAHAAGLSSTDIVNYTNGTYVGTNSTPPAQPIVINTSGAGDTFLQNPDYLAAKQAFKSITQAQVQSLETTYIKQASTIVQEIMNLDKSSLNYAASLKSLQEELETANARAQAAEDVSSANEGTEPVDVVQTPDIA